MTVAVVQVHQFSTAVVHRDKTGRDGTWRVYAMGARRDDERWIGWLEYVAADGRDVRVTGGETTQASFDALVYWATGLESAYLDGAMTRTIPSVAPGLPLTGERLVA